MSSHNSSIVMHAKDLSITWGGDQRYWRWDSVTEAVNSDIEVAVLLNVCWLDVSGTLDSSFLSPGAIYRVVFVVKIEEDSYGLNSPVNLKLETPDGKVIERRQQLQDIPKKQWVGLDVGFFENPKKGCSGEIKFSLFEHEDGQWKKGLIIKQVIIQAIKLNNSPDEKPCNNFSIMTYARDLSITWGDDKRYWRWDSLNEAMNVDIEVAVLLQVWWLDVSGKLGTSYLKKPGAAYEVAFIVKMEEDSCGWNVPVNLRLETPDGEVQERKEKLQDILPKNKWVALSAGRFLNLPPNKGTSTGEIKFSLFEHSDKNAKKGLVIKGVVVQPTTRA